MGLVRGNLYDFQVEGVWKLPDFARMNGTEKIGEMWMKGGDTKDEMYAEIL